MCCMTDGDPWPVKALFLSELHVVGNLENWFSRDKADKINQVTPYSSLCDHAVLSESYPVGNLKDNVFSFPSITHISLQNPRRC